MDELVFLKLGGSLLTDKTRPQTLRTDVLARLASEIAAALAAQPGLRLLVGHGSGSFGHVAARQHGTRAGVRTLDEWRGYAEVAHAAAELNHRVVAALRAAGVPALRFQPSASARCYNGELVALAERPLVVALDSGLTPVIYGDVALDDVRGGAIVSTEELFRWLAPRLKPHRVILVGEVAGVLTADPASADPVGGTAGELIPEITPDTFPAISQALGGSRGVDVTGGMVAKVAEMIGLVSCTPALRCVQVISGLVPGLVGRVLVDPALAVGTRIVSGVRPEAAYG